MPTRNKKQYSYEEQRQINIARNEARMSELEIPVLAPNKTKQAKTKQASKKRKASPTPPTRRSSRPRKTVDYREPSDAVAPVEFSPADAAPKFAYNPEAATTKVKVGYDLSEGTRSKDGRLKFKDHPEFCPLLTPKQMLKAGVFGGCYFNPRGGKPGIKYTSKAGIPGVGFQEFPKDWFTGLDKSLYFSRRYFIPTNKYKVKAGQDQAAWEQSGWIHPQDPRGWFQWYCRFFTGRRTQDDERQIGRWRGVCGKGCSGRWTRALCKKIVTSNKAFDDGSVSPVIRQTLLHWAYELTETDFQDYCKLMGIKRKK